MKKIIILSLLFATMISLPVFAEDNEASPISIGADLGFGNVLEYTDGFKIWTKPNINWDIFSTGFALNVGLIIPIHPFYPDADFTVECNESYAFNILNSDFEGVIALDNSLSFSDPVQWSGFIVSGINYNAFSMMIQWHYLSDSEFGAQGIVFAPGYSHDFNNISLAISTEIGLWNAAEEIEWCIEPIISIGYQF